MNGWFSFLPRSPPGRSFAKSTPRISPIPSLLASPPSFSIAAALPCRHPAPPYLSVPKPRGLTSSPPPTRPEHLPDSPASPLSPASYTASRIPDARTWADVSLYAYADIGLPYWREWVEEHGYLRRVPAELRIWTNVRATSTAARLLWTEWPRYVCFNRHPRCSNTERTADQVPRISSASSIRS